MTFCLNSLIIKPQKGLEIKNAIILLHGYGGDGKDISTLSLNWKRYMPNTLFICPDGHEPCALNPMGYQWFDLTKEDPNYILLQTTKAENILKKFIYEIREENESINDLIKFAGGLSGPIDKTLTLKRIGKKGFEKVTSNFSADSKVNDYDLVFANNINVKTFGEVELSGAVISPSIYATDRYPKIQNLIPNTDVLKESAYTFSAIINS